jgi:SAM-dependent methyltransferase
MYPDRVVWALEVIDPGPDDRLLEIGCGPGVAVAAVCERLAGGRIVAVDRSATAIRRAERRNAAHAAAGRAVFATAALEDLAPGDLPDAPFDAVFAMNVNLFWVRSPARELDLVRRLLAAEGALYLFYGYGGADRPATVPDALLDHLTAGGFRAEVRRGASVVGVVARPRR